MFSMEHSNQAALRAQLELELHNKRHCAYEPYQCSQLSVDNSKYCLKHILYDKNAPYKQCNYMYQTNGKRCHLPAPKGDKKDLGYCNEHALKTTLAKNKQNAKNPPPLSAETLLTNLSHYVKKPRNRSPTSAYISDEEKNNFEDTGDRKVIKAIDPFVDIDANAVYNAQCNEVLDMCSESESDVEPSTYASVWHDANADSSDNESIDSEEEDPLKHANVYTAEEISLLTRDKLVRLQSLYIEQYKHLRVLLKERRRKYIHSLKREKETCCNIYNQVRDNPKEQRLYTKLKQYNKYHKACGQEAVLDKKFRDLRAKISDGAPTKTTNYSKCTFTEGGVKCGERSLPMAKHCRKHILEDSNQVLFKACGKVNGDVECNTPVEAIFDDSTCKLHMEMPPIRSYNQPRESESDADDTLELPPHFAVPPTDIKTEMIDYSLPSLPKMETLPSILFEDSAESLSSTLQYSTSEFTESFIERSSVAGSNTTDLETNISENGSASRDLKTDYGKIPGNDNLNESNIGNTTQTLDIKEEEEEPREIKFTIEEQVYEETVENSSAMAIERSEEKEVLPGETESVEKDNQRDPEANLSLTETELIVAPASEEAYSTQESKEQKEDIKPELEEKMDVD